MNILVVGQGGREHALVWAIARNHQVKKIWAAPGNAGIAHLAECVNIAAVDIKRLACFAQENKIDLTVVGPEAPLVEGIVDFFRAKKLPIFGPEKKASRLEGSKTFAKKVMQEAGVPTARAQTFSDIGSAQDFASQLGLPVVIKADGLAAGKGVRICTDETAISVALSDMMERRCFGEAGARVLVEEFLKGQECSILALTDGKACILLEPSQDHKRLADGDQGPNTGGMGAYSPVPFVDKDLQARIKEDIFLPIIRTLAGRGILYQGVLYAGLILTQSGPKVLEFNCRFGDPETQVVLPRLKSDLLGLLMEVSRGNLCTQNLSWDMQAAVCVVLAAGGYPGSYQKGKPIRGLDATGEEQGPYVFHAGTCFAADRRTILTNGGRVLGVTGLGKDVADAKRHAYDKVKHIQFEDMIYRTDISGRSLHMDTQQKKVHQSTRDRSTRT